MHQRISFLVKKEGSDMTDQIRFERATEAVNLLIKKGWTIAFAESCTAGLAAGAL